VDKMLTELNAKQISEWIAYSNIEPFGEERADLRSAIIACTIANCNRGSNQAAFKVSDFMPKFEPEEPMSEDAMKKILGIIK
jgi:hypothetical protein